MKPHLPVPLLAVVVAAITAPCVLADTFADVTYQASGGRSINNASSITKSDANAPNGPTLDLANYTGTLSIVGSGNDIASDLNNNGGFGGRFILTNTTNANVTNLTVSISGGTEVGMGTVLENSSTAPQIVANNASFFTGSGTIAANIKIDAGGLRLNGSSSTTYTFTGKITGTGAFATTLGGAGSSIFTGDVSEFEGTWLNKPTANSPRTIQFGNGNACANSSVGGNFGLENKRIQAKFNYTGDYSVGGTVYASTLTIASGNATFSGTVDATTLNINSNATFSGTVSADTITIADAGSFSLSETGVYDLNGKTADTLTVGGNGTISMSGTSTFDGTLTANGSQISIADGTVFSSNSLVSLDTLGESNPFIDEKSPNSGNGFVAPTTFLLIANNTITENRTFTNTTAGELAGTTIKLVAGTGLVAETSGGSGEYYINQGTVVYGGSDNSAASASELILANGATLEFNQALATGVGLSTHGGTLQINEGVSLAANQVTANATTTLTGDGNSTVTSNSLGTNIQLKSGADGWTGTVTLSGYTPQNEAQRNLSGLVNGTNSTLELNGYTGWTEPWHGDLNYNIKLTDYVTDNGSTHAWTNTGYVTGSTTYTLNFSGKFSGDGIFDMNLAADNGKQNYTFSGDIQDWSGHILKTGHNNSTTTLTFQGSATNVNVDIEKVAGTLNVVAGADGVTFHKDITNVTSLAVNANVNATLEGTATTGTLTLNAGATATLSGDGTVALGTTTAPGRLSFEVLDKNAPAVATLAEDETAETPTHAATGSIHNGGTAAGSFSNTEAGSADTTYNNIKIKANSTSDFALLGTLNNSAVENNNTGTITVNAPGADGSIAGLYANKGGIIVSTAEIQEAVSVGVLSVAQGTAVSVVGPDSAAGTLETGNVMTVVNADAASSAASLTANLVVSDGATLTLPTALDLGGHTLTFSGNIANLNTTDTGALKTLLFSNADSVTFGNDVYTVTNGAIKLNGNLVADQNNGVLLNGSVVGLGGNILLEVVNDGTSGLINVTYSVPEPATATLGLLALAGLCLRRRRK